jgi:hypothetical protein
MSSVRPEITGRRQGATATNPATEPDAYTVPEFCERHRISVALFYKLRAQGKGPEVAHAGARRIVTREAAARWRAASTEAHNHD